MPRLLHLLVCAIATGYIAVLAVIVVLRLWYPYELEWLEGWMLDSVRQVMAGRPLYGPPSLEFVASVYNPVYFYVSAAFAWVMDLGFAPARLVSVLSTFGLLALLIFRLQPSARSAGLVAAGLYAASYRFSGAWMDIARSDSLFLALLFGAFVIGRDSESRWQDVVCGIAYALAFFTKQTTLAVLAMLFAAQLFIDRRQYWAQWVTFALLSAVTFAALDWASDGWYSYYTLDAPLHFLPQPDQLYFLATARLKLLPGLLALAVLIAALAMQRWRPQLLTDGATRERADAATWSTIVFAMALVVSSWAVFRQRGTFDNVFMPACLGLAIGAGLAYGEFSRGLTSRVASPVADRDWRLMGFGAATLLILQQFTVYAYNPLRHVPRQADRAAGDQFIAELRTMQGNVLVWAHGEYGPMAGKGAHLHEMAFIDAAGQQSWPPRSENHRRRRQQVIDTMQDALKRQVFDSVVIDRGSDLWAPYYLQSSTISEAPREFTGRDTRVGMVLARNPIALGGRLDPSDARLNFLFGPGWSAPDSRGRSMLGEEATIVVGLERGGGYQLQIGLRMPCGTLTGKATVFAWWNGKILERKTPAECGANQLIAALPPEAIDASVNTLRLSATWDDEVKEQLRDEERIGLTSFSAVPATPPR